MKLHEDVGAVRREVVLDRPLDEAFEDVLDLDWLERDAEVVEVCEPSRVTVAWADDDSTVVDITLEPLGAEATRVVVVETPVRVLQAASADVVAGLPHGPLALAA